MKNLNGCYLHNRDHWKTPKHIYNYYCNRLNCIDPCPLHSKENNLNKIYYDSRIFINPPYSDIKSWVKFIKNNIETNNIIYLLIPARTNTKYFHELMQIENCIINIDFIKGRLHFNESQLPAPFPSIIISFVKAKMKIINANIREQSSYE